MKSLNVFRTIASPTFTIRRAKIKKKLTAQGADVEKTLTNLGEVFYGPQDIYARCGQAGFK